MISQSSKYVTLFITAAVCTLCIGFLVAGCSGKEDEETGSRELPSDTPGFRFLDLNAASRLDDALRRKLREKLGSDAIWRRSPLDLGLNYDDFLQQHFGELHRLDRRLNYAPRERVEHDIIKLMYRYPQKKNLPFTYIELIFSSRTDKPLVFHIQAKQDGDAVIATLEDKYGAPGKIEWNSGRDRALFWRRPGEIMIASIVMDRYGQPEYGISIFFVDHIGELADTEEQERRQRQLEKEKAGKTAF